MENNTRQQFNLKLKPEFMSQISKAAETVHQSKTAFIIQAIVERLARG